MTEWIKKLWQFPVISGNLTVNHFVSGIVGSILNRCGKLFFELESENDTSGETIAHSEIKDDKLIYHLHDLALKRRELSFASVSLELTTGMIQGCILEIPWRSLLTDETIIRIDKIKIDVRVSQPIHQTGNLDASVSMIEHQPDSDDLLAAYSEISDLVHQYLGKTRLFLDTLQVSITGNTPDQNSMLTLMGLEYDGGMFSVDHIIFKIGRRIQLEARGLRFSYALREIRLSYLETRSDLLDYPLMFLRYPLTLSAKDSASSSYSFMIEEFKHHELLIIHLSLTGDQNFSIKSISFDSKIVTHDLLLSSQMVMSTDEIIVVDGKKLVTYLRKCYEQIRNLQALLVYKEPSRETGNEMILRLDAPIKLIWEGKVNLINFQSLSSSSLEKLRLIQGDLKVQADRIGWKEFLEIHHLSIRKSNLSYAHSERVVFSSEPTVQKLEIHGGRTESLLQLIDFVAGTVDYFRALVQEESLEESGQSLRETEGDFLLEFQNSSIIHPISQSDEKLLLTIEIKQALCSITHKLLHQLETDFTLSREVEGKALVRQLGTLQASQSEASIIEIDSLVLRIDPILFDQINYYLGSLERAPEWSSSEVSEEALIELQKALQRSTTESLDTFMRREQKIISASTITTNSNLKSAYLENLSRRIDDLQLSVVGLQPRSSSVRREVKIKSCQILLHDELLESQKQTEAFIRVSIKGVTLITDKRRAAVAKRTGAIKIVAEPKKPKPQWIDQYQLVVEQLAIVDQSCGNIDWKYPISFAPLAGKAFEIKADIHGDSLSVDLNFAPISLNIREETMLRCLAFVNNRSSLPESEQPMMIERFEMNANTITLSYYPMIADALPINTLLSLRNHVISLNVRHYQYLDGFPQLFSLLRSDTIAEINPSNYYQFLPSLGLTKPCAEPVSQIITVWNCYLSSDSNRRKLRTLTRKLGKGIDVLSEFFQDKKLYNIIEFFSSGGL